MYRKLAFAFVLLLVIAFAAACGSGANADTTAAPTTTQAAVSTDTSAAPVTTAAPTTDTTAAPTTTTVVATGITVTDGRGKQVTLDKPATRIVAGLPNALNNLYMLGLVKEVVGVHKWSLDAANPDLPFISQIDPRLTTGELKAINGNIELIISLKPDLVILQASDEMIATLESDGIKVYGVNVVQFADVDKVIKDLGTLTGKEARAKEIVEYTTQKLKGIQEKVGTVADAGRPSGMFVWGPSTLDIAGGVSSGNAILAAAGAKNVAADISEEHIVANMEQVVKWDPSVIVIWNTDKLTVDSYLKDTVWKTVAAASKGQVYMLPSGFYTDLWTPKYQYAILATAKWMYPALFPDVDLDALQKEMITSLYQFDFK